MGTKGSFIRALAISIAVHALLFLSFASLITKAHVVSEAPSITFVEARITGSGGAGGSGNRKAVPKAVNAAVPAMPLPTPQQKAPPPQAQGKQAPLSAADPMTSPATSPPASSEGPPNQVASGESGGPPGSGGGSGGGTASASPVETDADLQLPIADINPVPLEIIAASYPPSARRLGQQGLVKVETNISARGIVIDCRVAVSSGFPSLDNAALEAVQQARFLPAMKNGRQVASKILIPIRFKLTRQ
jgi:periplasmic protein TonB